MRLGHAQSMLCKLRETTSCHIFTSLLCFSLSLYRLSLCVVFYRFFLCTRLSLSALWLSEANWALWPSVCSEQPLSAPVSPAAAKSSTRLTEESIWGEGTGRRRGMTGRLEGGGEGRMVGGFIWEIPELEEGKNSWELGRCCSGSEGL